MYLNNWKCASFCFLLYFIFAGCNILPIEGSKLFWTDPNNDAIYQSNLDGGDVEQVLVNSFANPVFPNPTSIALDPINKLLYFSDPTTKFVFSSVIGINSAQQIIGNEQIQSLSIDENTNILYLGDSSKQSIYRYSSEGISIWVADSDTSNNVLSPRSLLVVRKDNEIGWLYWVESRHIRRKSLSGGDVLDVYVAESGASLQGVTWDKSSSTLIFTDDATDNVYTIKINEDGQGTNFQTLIHKVASGMTDPRGIVFDERTSAIFICDSKGNNAGNILRSNREGNVVEVIFAATGTGSPTQIVIYHPVPSIQLSASSFSIVEGGLTKSLSVVLEAPPMNKVTLHFNGETKQLTISPLLIEFDTNNWDIAQIIVITAIDDSSEILAYDWSSTGDEGDHISFVKISVDSSDARYSSLEIPSINVTISDNHARKVYWTDYGIPSVQRSNWDGSGIEILPLSLSSRPRGIAIDSIASKVYFADPAMGVIRQIDLLGGSAENIASGLDFPTDVALSRILSRVFWIDSMTDSIHSAKMDGSNSIVAITSLSGAFALTIHEFVDHSTNILLFWTDQNENLVKMANVSDISLYPFDATDPSKVSVVVSINPSFLTGIAAIHTKYGIQLVVADAESNELYRLNTTELPASYSVLISSFESTTVQHLDLPPLNIIPNQNLIIGCVFWLSNQQKSLYKACETDIGEFEIVQLAQGLSLPYGIAVPSFLPGLSLSHGYKHEVPGQPRVELSQLTLNESTTASYNISLDVEPTADVTIKIAVFQPFPCIFQLNCSMVRVSDSVVEAKRDHSELLTIPESLVFTPQNWSLPQLVTVFALDDEVDQGKRLIFLRHWTESSDSKYQVNPSTVGNRMSMATMLVYVEEDDQAGIHLSHSNLQVLEGKSVDYNITLTSQPYEPVTIQVIPKHFSPPEDGIPKLGYDHSKVIAFPSQLVFTPNNYSSPQSVTLFAVDDDFDQGQRNVIIEHIANSDDAKYNTNPIIFDEIGESNCPFNGYSGYICDARIVLQISEDDVAGSSISTSAVTLTEHGGCFDAQIDIDFVFPMSLSWFFNSSVQLQLCSDGFDSSKVRILTLSLFTSPYEEVDIEISSQDSTQVFAYPSSLRFSALCSQCEAQIVLFAKDDHFVEPVLNVDMSLSMGSLDPAYNKLFSISTTLIDNDQAGLYVLDANHNPFANGIWSQSGHASLSVLNTKFSEEQGKIKYWMRLASQPTLECATECQPAQVRIEVRYHQFVDDHTPVILQKNEFLLDWNNWNTPQLIVLDILDDMIDQGNRSIVLWHVVASSTDPVYSGANSYEGLEDLRQVYQHIGDRYLEKGETVTNLNPFGVKMPVVNALVIENDVSALVVQLDDYFVHECEEIINGRSVVNPDCVKHYHISLSSAPYADVTVSLNIPGSVARSVLRVTPESFIFQGIANCTRGMGCNHDQTTWNIPQKVDVIAMQDFISQGDRLIGIEHITSSNDTCLLISGCQPSRYTKTHILHDSDVVPPDVQNPQTLSLILKDDDIVGLTISQNQVQHFVHSLDPLVISVLEGTKESWNVRLNTLPRASVTIHIRENPVTQEITIQPTQLIFTSLTWNQYQTVQVFAIDNSIRDFDRNTTVFHIVSSNEAGVACNSLQDAVNVKYLDPDSMCRNMYNATQTRKTIISIQDDDESGIALEANPFYMVEGTSGRVRLHSLSQPINPVTVTISTHIVSSLTHNVQLIQVSPDEIVITPDNWQLVRSLLIESNNNDVFEGFSRNHVNISFVMMSEDELYNNIVLPNLPVYISDNDAGCPIQYTCQNGGQCSEILPRKSSDTLIPVPNSFTAQFSPFLHGSFCDCSVGYGGEKCDYGSGKFSRLEILVDPGDSSFDVSFHNGRSWPELALVLDVPIDSIYIASAKDEFCEFSHIRVCVLLTIDIVSNHEELSNQLVQLATSRDESIRSIGIRSVQRLEMNSNRSIFSGKRAPIGYIIFIIIGVSFLYTLFRACKLHKSRKQMSKGRINTSEGENMPLKKEKVTQSSLRTMQVFPKV